MWSLFLLLFLGGGVFRFENYCLLNEQFSEIVSTCWSSTVQHADKAKNLTAKFKMLRKKIREWQSERLGLKTLISNCRSVIHFLEVIGDFRDLSVEEWNFKEILKDHLLGLLEQERLYWKQRGAIKWVKLGDTGTKFFHAHATIRHRGKF